VFNNEVKLNLNVLTNLCDNEYSVSCGSEAGMETHALLVNGIVNKALHFWVVDPLLNYASGFVVNWTAVRAVRWPQKD